VKNFTGVPVKNVTICGKLLIAVLKLMDWSAQNVVAQKYSRRKISEF
jgi:hypothetical protein